MKHQGISTNEQETLKLELGQPIWVQDSISLSWKSATMKEHVGEPFSYWIQTVGKLYLGENKKTPQRLHPTPFELSDHLEKFQQFLNLDGMQSKFPSQEPAVRSASPPFAATPMKARNTSSFPSSTTSPPTATEPRRSIRINKGVPPARFTPS